MKNKLLHTPVGVRDLYGKEFMEKACMEKSILSVISSYGYQQIQTPAFEYFDLFSNERGSVSSKDMYKFFDRSGNTLVLRPDITPSIARCVAKYFMEEEMPIRLCYHGNTYINDSDYQGKLKEYTQIGAELVCDGSVQADAEMIVMLAEALRQTGLSEFRVEIGDVGFFKALIKEAEISQETEDVLREYIAIKNYFEIEKLVASMNISKNLKKAFLKIPELFGSVDVLQEAKKITTNTEAIQAIEQLETLYSLIKTNKLEKYVSFDLGTLGQYKYYSGVVFKAFTYGTGDSLVTGGRYDHLLSQFGKNAPSVGFAINTHQLFIALNRQKVVTNVDYAVTMILYDAEQENKAFELARENRKNKIRTILQLNYPQNDLSIYFQYAKRNSIKRIHYLGSKETITYEVEL